MPNPSLSTKIMQTWTYCEQFYCSSLSTARQRYNGKTESKQQQLTPLKISCGEESDLMPLTDYCFQSTEILLLEHLLSHRCLKFIFLYLKGSRTNRLATHLGGFLLFSAITEPHLLAQRNPHTSQQQTGTELVSAAENHHHKILITYPLPQEKYALQLIFSRDKCRVR